jgi:hypothetical protein
MYVFPMIALQRRYATILRTVFGLLVLSCGTNEDPANPADRLCRAEPGVGLVIIGSAAPLEFCVDAADADVSFANNRYDVRTAVSENDTTYSFQMIFHERNDFPVVLNPTSDLAVIATDQSAVWLFYEEIPANGGGIRSVGVTGGTFTLGVNDSQGASGTLEGIVFEMEEASSGQAAGGRTISEGYFVIVPNLQTTQ